MKTIKLLFCAAILSTAFSCKDDESDLDMDQKGGIEFSISFSELSNDGGRVKSTQALEDADKIVVTIQKSDGGATEYTSSKIEIYKFGNAFISQKLSLKTGSYKLTAFFLIDENDNVIYATPLAGSQQAQNVDTPLPIPFSINKDGITAVSVEVLSTDELTPDDFGLVGFQFAEVETLKFLINVSEQGQLNNLLPATLTVSNGAYSYTQQLDAIAANVVSIKGGFANYTLHVTTPNYTPYSFTFTKDSLLTHKTHPLTIELAASGGANNLTSDSLALVALYNAANGANWTRKANWLTGNVSTWYGVMVSGGRVTTLHLNDNNLVGTIPTEIGNLTSLTVLVLNINQLSGSIPAEIGNLTLLTYLDLSANQLSGNIPEEIGSLSSLEYLYLRLNQLSGSIPVEIGNLTSLVSLELQINQLSGSIPVEIGNLTSLTELNLQNNQLSGSIPVEIGNLNSLFSLSFFNNQFTFAGMETVVQTFGAINYFIYAPQANINIIKQGSTLSVNAGGTLANNTYKWYKNGGLVATITGNNAYVPSSSGSYHVTVTNSITTGLTLTSNTIAY